MGACASRLPQDIDSTSLIELLPTNLQTHVTSNLVSQHELSCITAIVDGWSTGLLTPQQARLEYKRKILRGLSNLHYMLLFSTDELLNQNNLNSGMESLEYFATIDILLGESAPQSFAIALRCLGTEYLPNRKRIRDQFIEYFVESFSDGYIEVDATNSQDSVSDNNRVNATERIRIQQGRRDNWGDRTWRNLTKYLVAVEILRVGERRHRYLRIRLASDLKRDAIMIELRQRRNREREQDRTAAAASNNTNSAGFTTAESQEGGTVDLTNTATPRNGTGTPGAAAVSSQPAEMAASSSSSPPSSSQSQGVRNLVNLASLLFRSTMNANPGQRYHTQGYQGVTGPGHGGGGLSNIIGISSSRGAAAARSSSTDPALPGAQQQSGSDSQIQSSESQSQSYPTRQPNPSAPAMTPSQQAQQVRNVGEDLLGLIRQFLVNQLEQNRRTQQLQPLPDTLLPPVVTFEECLMKKSTSGKDKESSENALDQSKGPDSSKQQQLSFEERINPNEQVDPTCPICLEPMYFELVFQLPCGHVLHEGCGRSWFNVGSTCPVCRHGLRGEQPDECQETGDSTGDNNNSSAISISGPATGENNAAATVSNNVATRTSAAAAGPTVTTGTSSSSTTQQTTTTRVPAQPSSSSSSQAPNQNLNNSSTVQNNINNPSLNITSPATNIINISQQIEPPPVEPININTTSRAQGNSPTRPTNHITLGPRTSFLPSSPQSNAGVVFTSVDNGNGPVLNIRMGSIPINGQSLGGGGSGGTNIFSASGHSGGGGSNQQW